MKAGERGGRAHTPETHALVERRVVVDSFDGDADSAGARQRTVVLEHRRPRRHEPQLEVFRMIGVFGRRQRRCHDDGDHDDRRGWRRHSARF